MAAQLITDLNLFVKDLCECHIRLIGYGKQAHRELKHNIGRIFEALSFSKQVQALYILNHTGCFGNTRENLAALLGDMGSCIADKPVEDSDLSDIIRRFNEIEEKSSHLYTCALDSADMETDLNIGDINVCSRCGYTLAGDIPKECTVCHSPSGYFRLF